MVKPVWNHQLLSDSRSHSQQTPSSCVINPNSNYRGRGLGSQFLIVWAAVRILWQNWIVTSESWHILTSFHCVKIEPKYPWFRHYHLALMMSFGATVCAVVAIVILQEERANWSLHCTAKATSAPFTDWWRLAGSYLVAVTVIISCSVTL